VCSHSHSCYAGLAPPGSGVVQGVGVVGDFPAESGLPNPFVLPHRFWIVIRLWGLAIAGALLAFGMTSRAEALAAEHGHSQPHASSASGTPAGQGLQGQRGQHGQQGSADPREGTGPRVQLAPPGHARLEPPGHARSEPPGLTRLEPPGYARSEPPGHSRSEPPGQARPEPPGHARSLPLSPPAASPLRLGAVTGAGGQAGMPTMPIRAPGLGRRSQSLRLLLLHPAQAAATATVGPSSESSESAWVGCPPSVPGRAITSRASAAAVFLAGLNNRVHLPAWAGRLLPTDERWSAIAWALRLDRPG
jgi:hypothetical protein